MIRLIFNINIYSPLDSHNASFWKVNSVVGNAVAIIKFFYFFQKSLTVRFYLLDTFIDYILAIWLNDNGSHAPPTNGNNGIVCVAHSLNNDKWRARNKRSTAIATSWIQLKWMLPSNLQCHMCTWHWFYVVELRLCLQYPKGIGVFTTQTFVEPWYLMRVILYTFTSHIFKFSNVQMFNIHHTLCTFVPT